MSAPAPHHPDAPKKLELDPKYDHYDFPCEAPVRQPGHPGYTTPEQDAQVFQLRTMLEQLGYKERLDTLCLVRVPWDCRISRSCSANLCYSCASCARASSMWSCPRRCEHPCDTPVPHYTPRAQL